MSIDETNRKPTFSDLQNSSNNPLVRASFEVLKIFEFEFTCSQCGQKSKTSSDNLPSDWKSKNFVMIDCKNKFCKTPNGIQVTNLVSAQMRQG